MTGLSPHPTSAPARPAPADRTRCYRFRHIVSFQETNVVGNVYFTHHLVWQGRCREMFLRDKAPSVLDDLAGTLRLVTLRVGCDYHAELFAFDEIEIEMRLLAQVSNRIELGFRYWRRSPGTALVADGRQSLAAMQISEGGLRPCPLPAALSRALAGYAPGRPEGANDDAS